MIAFYPNQPGRTLFGCQKYLGCVATLLMDKPCFPPVDIYVWLWKY
jgi:hypothetical protein